MVNEQKLDLLIRAALACSEEERNQCMDKLRVLTAESAEEMPRARKPQRCETVIRNLLVELGVPEHIKGSRYLVKAISAVVADEDLIDSITRSLWPLVAEHFNTKSSRVERAIRRGIEIAWERGDLEVLQKYFGFTVSLSKGKPTNGEFIARCANIVRERIEGGITRVLQNLSQLRSLFRPLRAL